MGQQFGDTTLTKVFVGGLAWETQKDVLREHFDRYGEILEAVIISDKVTGRSKGYGFVTFKEAEAAKKACEDPAPVINGRRANCNLASLGARRTRTSPPATPILPAHQPGPRTVSSGPPAQWYYAAPPPGTPQPPPSPLHHYPGVLPYYAAAAAYGYSPSYMTGLAGYNAKLSPSAAAAAAAGSYGQGQYYPAQGGMVANAMMPVYPMYHYHHQSQAMGGLHPHFFPPTTTASGAIAAVPAIVPKPAAAMPATTVCMAAEQVTGCS